MDSRKRDRIAAARELTEFLERHRSFSYIRLGDGEIFWLRHVQEGKAPPKYRYFENKPTSVEITMSTSGLEARHCRRFVEALENCSYLDYCDSNPNVRNTLHLVKFDRDPRLHRSRSAEVSNVLFEWTYYEMKDYFRRHRCLIAGAESALLRELWSDPDYRRFADPFLPADADLFFHQVREDGRNYSENLDLIEQDLTAVAREERIDTIFLSLGTGAKIVCYELARKMEVRALDFGSFSRALAYAGSPGYQTHRSLHNPFLFRVPFETYMSALERAHPALAPAMLVSKAHAQLALEVQDLQPLRFNSADTVTGMIPVPRERIDAFKDAQRAYLRRYRSAIRTDPEAAKLDSEFTRWRRKRGIGLDGQLFLRLVKAKRLCRRAMQACRLLPSHQPSSAAASPAFPAPSLYGDVVPRSLRDAVRFVLRAQYRRSVIERRHRARYARLREAFAPRLLEMSGAFVLAGPFEGLKYPERAAGSAWAPKLLGTYELELAPVIEEIVSRGYSSVVDIGAAEGYYAVGLAKRMPGAEIVCFEKEEEARSLLTWFATENGVASRLQIHGVATPSAVAATLEVRERALVICDAEGAEIELLDPGVVPALRRSDILVELHDFLDGDVAAILSGRFAPTHEITEVRARPRRLGDCPSRARLGRAQTLALLDECRPDGMRWFWMRRRRDGTAVFDTDRTRSIH
jgi:hypothetical protein